MEDGSFLTSKIVTSSVYAILLSSITVIAGYVTARWASKKAFNKFVVIVVGGMVIRLVLVLVILGLVLVFGDVHALAFVLAFVTSYFIFMMAEIFYINHRYNALKYKGKRKLEQSFRY